MVFCPICNEDRPWLYHVKISGKGYNDICGDCLTLDEEVFEDPPKKSKKIKPMAPEGE